MSYGLRLWNSSGNLTLDVNDRLHKYVTTFTGDRYADSFVALNKLYFQSGSSFNYAHMRHTFYLPYQGIAADGTWEAVINSVTGLAPQDAYAIPEYLTAYCTIQPGQVNLIVQTLHTFFYNNIGSPWDNYYRRTCNYSIDLYRI